MAFFHVFLPVSDYDSKISSPTATKSRAVHPFTTNDVLLFENIHKKGQKGQKQVTNGKFYVFARFRLFFGDFVAKGDEITGRSYAWDCSPQTTFLFTETDIEKGQKLISI